MLLKDDWEFNVLGIYNYRKPGPPRQYFDFFEDKIDKPRKHKQEVGDFERWYVRKFHV